MPACSAIDAARDELRDVRHVPYRPRDPSEPVGIWLELREDHRGLYARGRLIPEVARARELLSLLRAGAIDGLSIGFRTPKGTIDPRTRVRRLVAVDLSRSSIVTFPLLTGARVRAVKQAGPPLNASRARTRAEQWGGGRPRSAPTPAPRRRRAWAAWRRLGENKCRHPANREPNHPTGEPHGNRHRTWKPKPASAHDAVVTHAELMRAFDAFKEANDERLADRARGRRAARGEARAHRPRASTRRRSGWTRSRSRAARPAIGSERALAQPVSPSSTRRRSTPMCARGETANLRALEAKALSAGSNPDRRLPGAAGNRTQYRRAAERDLADPLASPASARISSNVYKKPFMATGARPAGSGETDARTQTTTADARRAVVSGDGALRHAGGDDAAARRQRGRYRRVAGAGGRAACSPRRKARPSSPATATTSRKASCSYNTVANGSWTWGNIGYVATGVCGRFSGDERRPTCWSISIFALKAGYRQNAAFVMNRKTQSLIRKFKDTTGNYIWQPPASPGGTRHADELPGASMPKTCRTSPRIRSRSRSAISSAAISSSTARASGAARSLFRQALRAVLHDQARRRRRAGLRRDQAAEVRGELRTALLGERPPSRFQASCGRGRLRAQVN